MSLAQRIRFFESRDGVRIAYSVVGRGPPLVMLSGGHSHLELDPAGPVARRRARHMGRGARRFRGGCAALSIAGSR